MFLPSPSTPLSSPLAVILAVSAIKEGVEDYNRHRQDYIANNRSFGVVRHYKAKSKSISRGSSQPGALGLQGKQSSQEAIITAPKGRSAGNEEVEMQSIPRGGEDDDSDQWLTPVTSKDIKVGQWLRIYKDEEFPADIVLISSSNPDATAYVNTANLDGEAVPKVRVAPGVTLHADTPEKLLRLSGRIKAEPANASLYQFQARIEMDPDTVPSSPPAATSEVHIDEQGDSVLAPTPRQDRAANVDKSGRLLFPVGDQQLCLRGSRLVNTDWVYGLVVYTGYQTKMMLNRNAPRIKASSFEHQLNKFVLFIFIFNFCVCLVLSISYSARNQDFGSYMDIGDTSGLGWLLNFLTQYILFSFMIPISLYVTIELVRVGQVFFMMWDRRMHYKDEHNTWKRMQVKSSSLNEELGCIQYVFSDKTGTLTNNKMELSAMSVAGQIYFERPAAEYALEEADDADEKKQQNEEAEKPRKTHVEEKEEEDEPGAKHQMVSDLVALAMKGAGEEEKKEPTDNSTEREFFWCILTCNSVLPQRKAPHGELTRQPSQNPSLDTQNEMDKLESINDVPSPKRKREKWLFQSMSPDETALCETCHRHGLTMAERKGNTVTVNYQPLKPSTSKNASSPRSPASLSVQHFVFTIVATLDFTSTRARMSVVVRQPDDTYRLYTKGADSAIYKRLEKEETEKDHTGDATSHQAKTAKHVETFAGSGSRTLCYAYRSLSQSEFQSWEKTYQQAVNALEDREALVELAFDELEHSMTLLGATGVEDQLQELVPESIDYMIKAGLKVIVLTGDKKETAVTISKQSALVQDHFALLYMQGTTKEAAKSSLDETLAEYRRLVSDAKPQPFALAIDGLCMEICLKYFREEFIELFVHCQTIVSYRSTPRQKALCVAMAKIDLNASVLAIGDGANDVSSENSPPSHPLAPVRRPVFIHSLALRVRCLVVCAVIQEAKVGVGILGKEGAHAAMSADYVIHRFYHLVYLIFIQGRYNYYRTAKVCFFSFYKNMLYSLPQIYYSYYALNTGQTLYVAIFQSTFNLLYTSIPPLVAGWYEKDLPDDLVLAYPASFQKFKDETIFDFRHFFGWLLVSFYQGTVLYLFIHFAVMGSYDASGDIMQDGRDIYLWLYGTEILFAVILLANVKMLTALDYITWFNVGAALLGLALFFLALIIFSLHYSLSFSPDSYLILQHLFYTNLTWAYIAVALGACYLPTLLSHAVQSLYHPSTAQRLKVAAWNGGKVPKSVFDA